MHVWFVWANICWPRMNVMIAEFSAKANKYFCCSATPKLNKKMFGYSILANSSLSQFVYFYFPLFYLVHFIQVSHFIHFQECFCRKFTYPYVPPGCIYSVMIKVARCRRFISCCFDLTDWNAFYLGCCNCYSISRCVFGENVCLEITIYLAVFIYLLKWNCQNSSCQNRDKNVGANFIILIFGKYTSKIVTKSLNSCKSYKNEPTFDLNLWKA